MIFVANNRKNALFVMIAVTQTSLGMALGGFWNI